MGNVSSLPNIIDAEIRVSRLHLSHQSIGIAKVNKYQAAAGRVTGPQLLYHSVS